LVCLSALYSFMPKVTVIRLAFTQTKYLQMENTYNVRLTL
jgi:hypothetical protein